MTTAGRWLRAASFRGSRTWMARRHFRQASSPTHHRAGDALDALVIFADKKKRAGFLRPARIRATRSPLNHGEDSPQHLPSLQSCALSSTFSPTFCTSLPAPAMVLHAVNVAVENMANNIKAISRFIWNSFVDDGGRRQPACA